MIILPYDDMPKSCEECSCMNDGSCFAIPNTMRDDPYDYIVGSHGRQPYCPLIEVKPGLRWIRKQGKPPTVEELNQKYGGPNPPPPKP